MYSHMCDIDAEMERARAMKYHYPICHVYVKDPAKDACKTRRCHKKGVKRLDLNDLEHNLPHKLYR